jgi:hypothetical protein
MPIILASWETEIRRIVVQSQPKKVVLMTSISKITGAEWSRGVAQVVECLLCKCEALSSNPCPAQKKKSCGRLKRIFFNNLQLGLLQKQEYCHT